MSRLQKIFALGGVAVLILGAIIIRDRQAGYIAYNNFDYKTAEIEFSKSAERGDPWSSYYVGLMHDQPHFDQIDRKKAAKALPMEPFGIWTWSIGCKIQNPIAR